MKIPAFRFCLLALASFAALAQDLSPVAQSARKAIEGNPEVAAKFDAFRASHEEIGVASGAWLPHLDATANGGKRTYTYIGPNPSSPTIYEGGARLELSQLLWDGLATRREVQRLGHAKLLRWFEFVDATEQAGLDASKAWYDVERYRQLVALAEENYVQHKFTFDQVKSRVDAGVGRGVDLEQVVARVALAQSNLVTERANLHDVTERFLRIVGSLPPSAQAAEPALKRPLPPTQAEAMERASLESPAVAAAVENLRSARAAAEGRRSAYQPRVEARVRAAEGHNLDGSLFERRDATAELVLTWNLFNGGSDSARERQFARLLDQAQDLRDKACNDARQTVAIAFNDVRKLDEQLVYLDRNVVSIQKARDAYRQQFDIGQRSLLDLLNAENELYTAHHSFVEAQQDRSIAVVRVHAGLGDLDSALGLARPDAQALAPEAGDWAEGADVSTRCPLVPIDIGGASLEQLDRRATALEVQRAPAGAGTTPPAPAAAPGLAAPAPPPVPVAPSTQAPPTAAPGRQPARATPDAAAFEAQDRLARWAAAWSAKDADAYFAFYAPGFKPARGSHDQWLALRRLMLGKPGEIHVDVRDVKIEPAGASRVRTRFEQVYASSNFRDSVRKTLTWERVEGRWQIVGESNR